jgi:glycerol-3-phosphate dehydrogenase
MPPVDKMSAGLELTFPNGRKTMRRATDRLANETFDILVIGGGITGACVARDASLRGLKVALVERGDFANATSAHNSKLIHGGLRYLRNFELGLVRESLRERRIWQRIAPHLVHPLPFLVPLYGDGWKARATLAAGLTLYDLLSFDRGWLDDPAQRLPGHSWLSAVEARGHEPVLDRANLQGAFLYYDAQMLSPERLTLECLIDADAHGAAIANYVEADRLSLRNGKVEGCSVRDVVTNGAFDIRAKTTLVAAGPWADIFLAHALDRPASHKLLRSKGIHVLVPSIARDFALTVPTAHGHFFVLPWRGHTLLGTTDTAFAGNPDDVGVSEGDIASLFAIVNKHLPNAALTRDKVEFFYAGLRPLVDDGSSDTYGASRRSELVDHGQEDGLDGLFSAIGGKWTTSRRLAEAVVDRLVQKLGIAAARCETGKTRLPGAVPAAAIDAQVMVAIREEMALTLEDIVMRRTDIGQYGPPANATLRTVSLLMADALGWTDDRRKREIANLERLYRTRKNA